MSIEVCINLSDSDVAHFVEAMKSAKAGAKDMDAAGVLAKAREKLADAEKEELPDFITTRLKHVKTMVAMAEDKGFGLPPADCDNVIAALAYFGQTDDAIPDSVPVIGLLDDAIMIELCVSDLKNEIAAYNEFCEWRGREARSRGEDPATLMRTRVEWAEACRVEILERMHRQRRESYSSGSWKPLFFRVH